MAFKVTSWNRIVEYQLRVREFNATSGAYGNLTLISVTSTQNRTENDEYAEEVLITGNLYVYEVYVYLTTRRISIMGKKKYIKPQYLIDGDSPCPQKRIHALILINKAK